MPETKNDTQDVDLENNDESAEVDAESNDSKESSEDVSEKLDELQQQLEEQKAEASKYRRLLEKKEKKTTVRKAKADESADDDSAPDDLDYGEKAYLRSAINLKGSDELQLAKEWKSKYDMSVEEMESDEVFISKLTNLRAARESQAAIPKGNKRSGQTGTAELDIAIAKYKENGELPKEFSLRSKVVNKVAEQEQSSGMFSGPAVVGPDMRQG